MRKERFWTKCTAVFLAMAVVAQMTMLDLSNGAKAEAVSDDAVIYEEETEAQEADAEQTETDLTAGETFSTEDEIFIEEIEAVVPSETESETNTGADQTENETESESESEEEQTDEITEAELTEEETALSPVEPNASADDTTYVTDDGMYYIITEDNEIAITGVVKDQHYDKDSGKLKKEDKCLFTSAIIPEQIQGLPVTTIERNAFLDCINMSYVSLPDTVKRIGCGAFKNCESLTSISLPKDIETGQYMGENNQYPGAFFGCSLLGTVEFAEGTTKIPQGLFFGCDGLTEVTIPDTVTEIGKMAYRDCKNLQQLHFSEGLQKIDANAFLNCESLQELHLPDSLNILDGGAFWGCVSLREIKLPDTLKGIGSGAFKNCTNLQSAYIPKDIVTGNYMGENYQYPGAFFGCSALKTVKFAEGTTKINAGLFYGCDGLEEITIPNGVTEIYERAFRSCENLQYINFPEGLERIKPNAFLDCESLQELHLPDSLNILDGGAFWGCVSLREIKLPDTLKGIGSGAFKNCTSLQSAYIPKDIVTSNYMGENSQYPGAFFGCSALKTVKFAEGTTRINAGLFYGCDGLEEITIPNGVTEIREMAFKNCKNLQFITFSEGLERIRSNAFLNCESLQELYLPDSVSILDGSAFCGCVSLREIKLSDTLKGIGGGAFKNCTSLQSVYIPKDVETSSFMGASKSYPGAFYGCTALATAEFADGTTKIDSGLFYGCPGLTEVSIPDSVTSIGSYVFRDCGSLTEIYFLGAAPEMNDKMFEGVTATAYYPANAEGWDADVRKDYGGTITWKPYGGNNSGKDSAEVRLSVYKNRKKSDVIPNDYVVCEGAEIRYGEDIHTTDKSGNAKITFVEGQAAEVSLEGYVSRTFSAERLANSKDIYLQRKSDGAPVISGVWVNDVDVLNKEYAIDLLSRKEITIEVEDNIDWGGNGPGKLVLVQEQRSVEFDGNTLKLVMSDYFDVTDTIYIMAFDAKGNSTKKELKFANEVSPMQEALDGLSFDLGEELSITLPKDTTPSFLAGQKLGIGTSLPIDLTACVEDGKVYVAIGYKADGLGYESSDPKKKTAKEKEKTQRIKSFIGDLKDVSFSIKAGNLDKGAKKLKNIGREFKDAISTPKGRYGFDVDFTILGFAEGYYKKDAGDLMDITWLNSGVILNPTGTYSNSSPTVMVGPVPMFLEFEAKADILGQFNVILNETVKNFTPNGEISGDVSFSAGAGVGISKILYASGGGNGSFPIVWKINPGAEDYFKLAFQGKVYLKAGLLFFEYKKEWDIGKERTLWEYPSSKLSTVARSEDLYDSDSYEVTTMSYLEDGSEFVANEGEDEVSTISAESSGKTEPVGEAEIHEMKTNVYRDGSTQFASFPNGDKIAFWLDADGSDDVNAIAVYYSRCTNGEWSEPAPVQADGTTDYAPTVFQAGDKVYLAWQNAATTFDANTASLDSVASAFDISVAVFDQSGMLSTDTIKNPNLDMNPILGGEDGHIYVAWVNNSENDWFGQNSGNNVMYAQYSDGNWTDAVNAYSGMYSVDSVAVDYNDGLNIAYCADGDGNPSTTDDINLFENGVKLTDSSCSSGVAYHGHELYWYSEGKITNKGKRVGDAEVNHDRYQIIEANGEKALLYLTQENLGSKLMATFYNSTSKTWGEAIALTDGSEFIRDFSANADGGEMQVLLTVQPIVDADGEDPYGAATLRLMTIKSDINLSLDEVNFDNNQFSNTNVMELEAVITNKALQTVQGMTVQITDAEGNELANKTISTPVVSGETVTAKLLFSLKSETSRENITVRVKPSQGVDVDETDNEQTLEIGYEDLALRNVSWGRIDEQNISISADVVNCGFAERSNVSVTLLKGSADGEELGTESIDEIAPLGLGTVSFETAPEEDGVYYIAIKESGDEITSNDSDFVYIGAFGDSQEKQMCAEGHTFEETSRTPSTCTEKGAVVYTCTVCGNSKAEELPIDPENHSFRTVIEQQALCNQAGSRHRECVLCGYREASEPIPASGVHTYGPYAVSKRPTVFQSGTKSAVCKVCGHMDEIALAKLAPTIKLNASSIKLKRKQSTTKVSVSGLAEGDYVTGWKSSNTKIVTVNQSGKISAKKKTGKATVTVSLASGLTRNITVKVQKDAVKTTKITGLSKNLTLHTGAKYKLTPEILPITSVQKVKYKSSNKKIAKVSSKGLIQAKKAGKAKITVTSGKKKYTVTVTVQK